MSQSGPIPLGQVQALPTETLSKYVEEVKLTFSRKIKSFFRSFKLKYFFFFFNSKRKEIFWGGFEDNCEVATRVVNL